MITIRKDNGVKFATYEQALKAFSSMQFDYMKRGFLVSCNVCTNVGYIQLTVHFDLDNPPTESAGFIYSKKEISSFLPSDVTLIEPGRIRAVDYYFDVDYKTN